VRSFETGPVVTFGFAAAVSELTMEAGFDIGSIRVERFGPTG
jgi:hypothetical protein